MYQDANDSNFNASVIDCDIAIVGAGPAGITLAEQFKNTPYKVCLLESGGFETNANTQKLSTGSHTAPSSGVEKDYLSQHSQRIFGGTGSVWGGFCREMDALDFEQRGFPFSHQWPITLEELKPFYTWHALERKYNTQTIHNQKIQKTGLNIKHYEKVIYPFHVLHRNNFEEDKNIRVVLNATVKDIVCQNNQSIDHLNIINLATQKSFSVKAKIYILACGGAGNVKLLLNANDIHKNGLGNTHDQVGRYFMEHPHFQFYNPPALLWLADKEAPWLHLDKTYKPAFYLNDDLKKQEKLLNFCAMISPSFDQAPDFSGAKQYQPNFSALSSPGKQGAFYSLAFRAEQSPNPNSRMTLSNKKDALGLRQIHLDWQLNSYDKSSLLRSIYLLTEELGKHSLGRMKLLLDEDTLWQSMVGGGHLMGTTRMSDTAETGVVDSDCKIHDIDNIYIAGSSVFSTAGVSNPTLTIMALARRLGQYLKSQLDE